MTNRLCPKCNKSRGTIKVTEQDSKTKKYWVVEKCFTCHFNFDLEEQPRAIEVKKKSPPDDGSYFGKPRGGWIV